MVLLSVLQVVQTCFTLNQTIVKDEAVEVRL